jgi:hypothetical protein
MTETPIVTELLCTHCGDPKPLADFARDQDAAPERHGRQTWCRSCQSSYFATWRGRIAPPRPVEPDVQPRPLTFRCWCGGIHPLESATGPKRCTKGGAA